jgi:hypothetical protein
MTGLPPVAWLALIGTLATLTSLVLAWGARDTKQILHHMDEANRASQEMSQAMLNRMDARAEARDRTDRLGGAEDPHA